ncbi:SusF/SusE family outer membrane protein [Chryseobacterium sp. M5A1_1a]
MKNLFKIVAIAFIGIWMVSCEKDEDQAILNETAAAKITVDKNTVVLNKDIGSETALNFVWTKSQFSIPVVSPQLIEFGIKGTGFKNSVVFNTDNNAVAGILTHAGLNGLMLTLGAKTGEVNQIEARLKTSVGAAVFYSNVLDLNITPYQKGPVYAFTDLFLIGDATAGGWTNEASNTKLYPLQKTSTANVYTYSGFFAKGGFKLIKTPGSWDTQYGMGSSAGILVAGSGSTNVPIAAAGYYKLTLNTAAFTYTLVSITPPAVTYTSISMIGTASGTWDTDLDLEQSTFDSHVWVKKNVMLNAGEFKFRANHAWTTSWGVAQEFFGTAVAGGANIPLSTTYHYDVYFNDGTGEFSIVPVN